LEKFWEAFMQTPPSPPKGDLSTFNRPCLKIPTKASSTHQFTSFGGVRGGLGKVFKDKLSN
jgi:hypothetical protein